MKKSTPSGKKERLASWAFLLPSLLGVTVFFILPFLVVIYYSFIDNPINKSFAGLDNYIGLMQNDAFRLAASNTMIFTVIAVPLAVVLSLLLAVVLDYGIAFKSTVKATFLCPLMVPTASVVLVFQVLFRQAGKQYAETGEIDAALLAEMCSPMIPEDLYAAICNGEVKV